jgi:hypothetical protein
MRLKQRIINFRQEYIELANSWQSVANDLEHDEIKRAKATSRASVCRMVAEKLEVILEQHGWKDT